MTDAVECAGPGVIVATESIPPGIKRCGRDIPVQADLLNGPRVVKVVMEHGQNEEQGELSEGDQVVRKDGMVVVAVFTAAAIFGFSAFLTEVGGDVNLIRDRLSVAEPGDESLVRCSLTVAPYESAASLTAMAVGIIDVKAGLGVFQLVEIGTGQNGRHVGDSLHG